MTFLPAGATARAQASWPCLPPDSTSAWLQRTALVIVADTSEQVQRFRSKLGLPVAGAADITPVQDVAICEALTVAVDAGGTIRHEEALVVVRIGQTAAHYAAIERKELGGAAIAVLDAQPKVIRFLVWQ